MGFLGISLILITVMGMLHVGLDEGNPNFKPKVSKYFRMGCRFLVGLLFIVISIFPPVEYFSPFSCLLIVACFMLLQGILEEYGRLEKLTL
jgi:hypothetical protein